jgi:hypothetical protein
MPPAAASLVAMLSSGLAICMSLTARVVKRCGITDSACRSQVPFAADV